VGDIFGLPREDPAAAVQRLVHDSAFGEVELIVLSGLELCTSGVDRQALFDPAVAAAWRALPDRARHSALREISASFVFRRLMRVVPQTGRVEHAPELNILRDARTDPAFALTATFDGSAERGLRMFGFGEAVVIESPVATPGRRRDLQRMGPLAWLFRYTLASKPIAADLLVKWTGAALPRKAKGRVIMAFRRGQERAEVVAISGRGKATRNGVPLDAGALDDVVSGLVRN
jgi:hypothetical protein